MLKDLTRSKLIQIWFVAVALLGTAIISFGAAMTVGTAALLLALSLVPPAIVLLLWPRVEPLTAAEVLRGDQRP
jgi:hypothetical protein